MGSLIALPLGNADHDATSAARCHRPRPRLPRNC